MPGEFTYFRKYIILKNNYTNIKNINPKGYGKIEIREAKGIISLSLENCEIEKDYRIYLLKDIDGQVMEQDLGRIITDSKGKSRTNISFNIRDLESKGFSIYEIDAILIRKGINVLLGGYIDKDNGTIDRFIKQLILEEKEEPPKTIQEVGELPIEEPIIVEELIEPIDIEELEEIQVLEIAEETEEPEEIEEADLPNYQSLEYIRRLNHKNQMIKYILSILRFFPQVQPLKMYLHGYSWWRIEGDGIDSYKGFLPYYNYLMSSNYKYPFLNNSATCLNLIKKHGHYLFGMYKEGKETKYYIYAVPGKFTTEEHPFKGVTGFNTWYESIDGIGYWVLYIDPMSGKIIHPINPMIPAY